MTTIQTAQLFGSPSRGVDPCSPTTKDDKIHFLTHFQHVIDRNYQSQRKNLS